MLGATVSAFPLFPWLIATLTFFVHCKSTYEQQPTSGDYLTCRRGGYHEMCMDEEVLDEFAQCCDEEEEDV